jgi:uncharacterized protein (DUF4415 family)
MRKKRPPLTDEEGEVRELTREDFKGMRPIREVDPRMLEAMEEWRKKLGRPKAETPKVHIGFRLSADVVREHQGERAWLQRPGRCGSAQGFLRDPAEASGVTAPR